MVSDQSSQTIYQPPQVHGKALIGCQGGIWQTGSHGRHELGGKSAPSKTLPWPVWPPACHQSSQSVRERVAISLMNCWALLSSGSRGWIPQGIKTTPRSRELGSGAQIVMGSCIQGCRQDKPCLISFLSAMQQDKKEISPPHFPSSPVFSTQFFHHPPAGGIPILQTSALFLCSLIIPNATRQSPGQWLWAGKQWDKDQYNYLVPKHFTTLPSILYLVTW